MKSPVRLLSLFFACLLMLFVGIRGLAAGTHDDLVLTFPQDFSVGKLFKAKIDTDGWTVRAEKQPIAEARGTVRVPADTLLKLKLSFDGASHASALEKIDARPIISLDARGVDNLTDDTLKSIAHLTNLRYISLDETDVSDRGMPYLRPLKKLANLSISRTLITGRTLAFLKNFPELQKLGISFNKLGGRNLSELPSLPKLETLDVKGSALTDEALINLNKEPNLFYLDLTKNEKLTDRGVLGLQKLSRLHILEAYQTGITSHGLEQLIKLPLKRLSFDLDKCSPEDLQKLHSIFPHCSFSGRTKSSYSPELFAPLK